MHGHKIASVNFAYKNNELILGLIERGKLIKKGDFKALEEFEKNFNKILLNEDYFEDFCCPVRAFITFHT